jgi:hypothetical protein
VAHPRELIRKAVVAILVAANTAAASRVRATRIEPNKKSQLPALAVYTMSEEVNKDNELFEPRELERMLKLEIVGWVAHADSNPADEQMDALAAQVEAAMDANRYLSIAFNITAVNATTNQFTIVGHGLATGDAPAAVASSGGYAAIPGGIEPGASYHVIVDDANTIRLALSIADAFDGTAIDITTAGSGSLQLLVSTASESILESTELDLIDQDGKSDPLIGVVTLVYSVTYRSLVAAPTLGDFSRFDAKYPLVGGVADTVPAEDLITEP